MASDSSSPEAALTAALDLSRLDIDAVGAAFEAMSPSARLASLRQLSTRQQAALFEAASGRAVELDDIVPPPLGPLQPVICEGKNSLLAFTHFQKRFCRSQEAPDSLLVGYNHQSMSWLTGPGYFVARQDGPEIAIDYTATPNAHPDGWPAIKSNEHFPGSLAFGGLVDYLRRVSGHITIGRATRRGKTLDNWFALCRVDPHR